MLIAERFAPTRLFKRDDTIVGRFTAMGCSCEVLVETSDRDLAEQLVETASSEAWRIERKFSRYNTGNIIHKINAGDGSWIRIDEETAKLLDFADRGYRMSNGLFDITSGVLRRAWKFTGGATVPSAESIQQLLPLVGWSKVSWNRSLIRLFPGMEIDLGGIGKEYAVDRVARLLRERTDAGFLVNFGGDIVVGKDRKNGEPWIVGVEDADKSGNAVRVLHLRQGAVATSGDSKKYVLSNGRRYGHILNPRTGWPVVDAPRSVTVAAPTCTEAGYLSTLAILNGANAETFLKNIGAQHWCYR